VSRTACFVCACTARPLALPGGPAASPPAMARALSPPATHTGCAALCAHPHSQRAPCWAKRTPCVRIALAFSLAGTHTERTAVRLVRATAGPGRLRVAPVCEDRNRRATLSLPGPAVAAACLALTCTAGARQRKWGGLHGRQKQHAHDSSSARGPAPRRWASSRPTCAQSCTRRAPGVCVQLYACADGAPACAEPRGRAHAARQAQRCLELRGRARSRCVRAPAERAAPPASRTRTQRARDGPQEVLGVSEGPQGGPPGGTLFHPERELWWSPH
jgi:hypothetical protein